MPEGDDIFGSMPDMKKLFKGMVEGVNESQADAAQSRFLTGEHLAEFANSALCALPRDHQWTPEQTARWVATVAIQLNELLLSHMAQQPKKKGEHDY